MKVNRITGRVEEIMARFSWKRASRLTGARQSFTRKTGIRTTNGGGGSTGGIISAIIVMAVFCGCDQANNSVIAEQLEEQLDRVLDGKNPEFDHIDIEEYSDAAVIRGRIAPLRTDLILDEMAERQREHDAEIDRILGKPTPPEDVGLST